LQIPAADLLPFGHDKAKVSQTFINSLQDRSNGKLILVTIKLETVIKDKRRPSSVGDFNAAYGVIERGVILA
jgi:formate--tetrahydrofolate ligase